jgi:hypothetical protein
MERILIIFFILISFSVNAKNIPFDSLSVIVQSKVNSSKFKSAKMIGDSWYEIKYKGLKEREYYTIDGKFKSKTEYTGDKMRVIDGTMLTIVILIITLLVLGQ